MGHTKKHVISFQPDNWKMESLLIKLGGSAITEKMNEETVNTLVLERYKVLIK